jgi:rSAM/selenodomain-associated transferase 2
VWEKATGERVRQNSQDRISVIVPTLNEEQNLSGVLDSVRAGGAYEVIVVDGGSSDGTVDLAESSGATVIRTRAGRGHQMNVGAAAAGGEVLLFLHGDTQLPEGFAACVRRVLQVPGTAAGVFSFAVSPPFRGSRLLQRLVNWRSRRLEMPYGDQALFTRAHVFAEMGGFPNLPIMEDLEFVRRLKRLGKIRTASAQVATSSRRWTNLGVWRTTLVNQLCIAAYYLKIPPSVIARLYGRSTGLS